MSAFCIYIFIAKFTFLNSSNKAMNYSVLFNNGYKLNTHNNQTTY